MIAYGGHLNLSCLVREGCPEVQCTVLGRQGIVTCTRTMLGTGALLLYTYCIILIVQSHAIH